MALLRSTGYPSGSARGRHLLHYPFDDLLGILALEASATAAW
jgi:hypothetical protein